MDIIMEELSTQGREIVRPAIVPTATIRTVTVMAAPLWLPLVSGALLQTVAGLRVFASCQIPSPTARRAISRLLPQPVVWNAGRQQLCRCPDGLSADRHHAAWLRLSACPVLAAVSKSIAPASGSGKLEHRGTCREQVGVLQRPMGSQPTGAATLTAVPMATTQSTRT
jgi:hypothetical protein